MQKQNKINFFFKLEQKKLIQVDNTEFVKKFEAFNIRVIIILAKK